MVYDPSGGFVTGGGWINSPAGAYRADPALTGNANFGFVAKYKKGTTVPTGQTEFQFHAAGLNFHSTSYDWLVVAGAKALFRGDGLVNGATPVTFRVSAVDSSTDLFRVQLWDSVGLLYDNLTGGVGDGQPISGGNIVVHSK